MIIKSKRTLSILISLAMIGLFAAIYLAVNSDLFGVFAATATNTNLATGTNLPASNANSTWSGSGGGGSNSVTFNVPYVFTVRFYAKGGSTVASQYILPGGKVKEPTDPTKKSLVFGGWYTDPAFKTAYDFNLVVIADLNLYAKWTDGKEIPPAAETTENTDTAENTDTTEASPFTDVAKTDWFAEAVAYVSDKELMVGTGGDLFAPEANLSRAMIVTILYRLAGEPDAAGLPNPFDDVKEGEWYADAVKWAAAEEIVLGYEDGRFGTDDPVTKEQLAMLIYRTQQTDGQIPNDILMDKEWADWDKISDWAKNPVNVLTIQGLFRDIPGIDFNPQTPATRAEIASILYRYLTSVES